MPNQRLLCGHAVLERPQKIVNENDIMFIFPNAKISPGIEGTQMP